MPPASLLSPLYVQEQHGRPCVPDRRRWGCRAEQLVGGTDYPSP